MELKLLTVIFDLRSHPNDLNQQVYTKGYILFFDLKQINKRKQFILITIINHFLSLF